MRVFEQFITSTGESCLICKTKANAETVLIGIGEVKDRTQEAIQVHKECYDLSVKMQRKEQDLVT